ncbi:MAG: hypothetical protein LBT99_02795 [Bifidobacteriaceae bacterium]|jgi:hypothetical protein|nr:hypothetical protein [Bifidobacteriaceae bacterium]
MTDKYQFWFTKLEYMFKNYIKKRNDRKQDSIINGIKTKDKQAIELKRQARLLYESLDGTEKDTFKNIMEATLKAQGHILDKGIVILGYYEEPVNKLITIDLIKKITLFYTYTLKGYFIYKNFVNLHSTQPYNHIVKLYKNTEPNNPYIQFFKDEQTDYFQTSNSN